MATSVKTRELEARIAELERRLSTRPPRRLHGRQRLAVVLAAAIATIGLPAAAVANHLFSDVPIGHTFHAEIANLHAARITTGCTPTTYCPDASVTRGQMAAFMTRGLSRIAGSSLDTATLTSDTTTIGAVTVKAGTVTGGQAMAKVDVALWIYIGAPAAGCPCKVVGEWRDPSARVRATGFVSLPGLDPGDSNWGDRHLALTLAQAIPTGVDQTFTVVGRRHIGTAQVFVRGNLSAITAPFSTSGAVSTSGVTLGIEAVPPR